jgi:hypothetical protein
VEFDINASDKQISCLNWSIIYDDAVFITPKSYVTLKDSVVKPTFKTINGSGLNNLNFLEIKKWFYNENPTESFLFKDNVYLNSVNRDGNKMYPEFVTKDKYLHKNFNSKRVFSKCKKHTTPITIGS